MVNACILQNNATSDSHSIGRDRFLDQLSDYNGRKVSLSICQPPLALSPINRCGVWR